MAGVVGGQSRQQLGLLVREIQVHAHVSRERDKGHQISRLHLCVDEFLRGLDRPVNLFRLHGRKIKEEQNHSPVARVQRRRSLLPGTQHGPACHSRYGRFRGAGSCQLVHIFEIKSGNLLLLPILKKREVSLFQVANEVAILVVRHYIHQHEFAGNLNARLSLSGLLSRHWRRPLEEQAC